MADPFRFKQFAIHQDRCAMKVGTDGILLGAWADADCLTRILDIGTGTGVVALMLAQRFPAANLDAVEIDQSAYQQASENFASSPWASRLHAICADVSKWSRLCDQAGQYSLIVANPPWFADSLKPPTEARSLARHTASLSSQDLIAAADRLLSPGGSLCVILPAEQCHPFMDLAGLVNLHCRRSCEVLPNAGKPAKRVLLQFCRASCPLPYEATKLIVETDIRHQYSSEFMRLTADFYLRF
jgi:tRNA1Val (adenine37-N6)-methyltransferase